MIRINILHFHKVVDVLELLVPSVNLLVNYAETILKYQDMWWRNDMETLFASLTFVKGIHRWLVDSPHKEPVIQSVDDFFVVSLLVWKSCSTTAQLSVICNIIATNDDWLFFHAFIVKHQYYLLDVLCHYMDNKEYIVLHPENQGKPHILLEERHSL